MNLHIPYGRTGMDFTLPDERVAAVLRSNLDKAEPAAPGIEQVRKALENPIGSAPLHELVRGKNNIVLIASDHTRPVPSKAIVPPMLEEIHRGNPDAQVTVLIATGCHRESTAQELEEKFGRDVLEQVKIVVHRCGDDADMVTLGTLPGGGTLRLNKIAAEADLLISEGFIEPHFFAGFSGGRKSVLPGICSRETVLANHCSAFIGSPYARGGSLEGNPLHKDMLWAARKVGLAFICNVVLNTRHEVIGAFAGDCNEAHLAGVEYIRGLCQVPPCQADIVITTNGGYPLDQNVYQSVKGMSTAELACRDGGVIIMVSACNDGHGGESFARIFRENPDSADILRKIEQVPADKTVPDQWEAQVFARILSKHTVILVSEAPDQMVRELHMQPAHSMDEAIALADKVAPGGSIAVIPDGISTLVQMSE